MDAKAAPARAAERPLPREEIGPFLILGLDKDADSAQIEAHWAQRVIWARKGLLAVSLGDINWAREVLNDPERRVQADAASVNVDTNTRELLRLAQRYALADGGGPAWTALDHEKPLADYVPTVQVPDADTIMAEVALPHVPDNLALALPLLRMFADETPDPWSCQFSTVQEKAACP